MVEQALSLGLSVIATEHFFTAFLSSPKASEQFIKPEDVREMFAWATLVSISFAIAVSSMVKNLWGLLATGLMIIIFFYVYKKAMAI